MGILSTSNQKQGAGDSSARRGETPQLTIVSQGTEITGDISAQGVVKVEGRIEGSIRSASQVLIAKGGTVQGDIYTKEAVLGGHVRGAVHAEDRVEVQASALIEGDIVTKRIQIAEGGQVNGAISMGDGSADVGQAVTARTDKTANVSGS
ncbi:MAG TPA: polymer-forming cytoskeletal protein [Gemmatimonadales bacterium]|nr:polymer-forming cytoskeletal protein [Gemmatimonadales bacterium]